MFRIPPRVGENSSKAFPPGDALSSARTGSNSPPASELWQTIEQNTTLAGSGRDLLTRRPGLS